MKNEDLNDKDLKNVCSYKAKKCLQCGAQTDIKDEKELFCSECGAPVLNKCSDYDCQEILNENAKFCKYCGSASIFYNYGLFQTKPSFSLNNEDDLPF